MGVDWELAVSIFFTGVIGVMLVMLLLQISIQVTSLVIRNFEKSKAKTKAEN